MSVSAKLLAAAVLTPTAAVAVFGSFVSLNAPDGRILRRGDGVLQFADGEKAVVKTGDGLSLVTIGSSAPGGGRVTSIAKQDGRWMVATSRGLFFVQD